MMRGRWKSFGWCWRLKNSHDEPSPFVEGFVSGMVRGSVSALCSSLPLLSALWLSPSARREHRGDGASLQFLFLACVTLQTRLWMARLSFLASSVSSTQTTRETHLLYPPFHCGDRLVRALRPGATWLGATRPS